MWAKVCALDDGVGGAVEQLDAGREGLLGRGRRRSHRALRWVLLNRSAGRRGFMLGCLVKSRRICRAKWGGAILSDGDFC